MAATSINESVALPVDITIQAPRITLRHLHPSDLEAIHALRGDPQVMKYSATHLPDVSLDATWEKMKPALPPEDGYEVKPDGSYHFGVCLTSGLQTGASAYTTTQAIAPGALVGDMGIMNFTIATDGVVEGEVGYMLDPRLWGRGLMSEALQAFVDHWKGLCKDTGLVSRLTAIVEPENVGSVRVLEKSGFKERRRFVEDRNGDLLAEMEWRL